MSRALLSQKQWKVYPGSFSIPLPSVPLPYCHKQSVPFRALTTLRPFALCCSGVLNITRVKVSAMREGLYELTLKVGIKHISYQFYLVDLVLIKKNLLLTFTCKQHHFKFPEFWTMTTKCAMKKQTGSYLCQAVPCRSKNFLTYRGHYLQV